MKNILIGGAWPYANNSLHIGHLVALFPGDVIARYYRLKGDNVIYVSGTDSHGTPITLRAKKENINPSVIVDKYHNEFSSNFKALDFSYDLYASTEDEEHKEMVKEYFLLLKSNGYIYEKEELEDYCENCKSFLADREIEGICPCCGKLTRGEEQCEECLSPIKCNELKDKSCKLCGSKTTLKPNKHLYFALSKFQNQIERYVDVNSKYWRKNAINETKKYLTMGLIDRATTRQLDWGVEVPIDGYEDKRIYVWVEAVLGYLTAARRVAKEKNIDFDSFIDKDSSDSISYYIHGKDNIVFHTIIYPALIMGFENNYELPKYIISSEYLNVNNQKMSKSKGGLITINEMIEKYNSDSIRYFSIANGPEKKDINFSEEDFIQIHNKFLVGVYGNFVNRNLSFISKKFDNNIPNGIVDNKIIEITKKLYEEVGSLIEKGELKLAIEKVMDYITLGNKYYDENTPWIKVKEDIEAFNDITYTCIYMIANISNLLNPFLPKSTNKIKEILNLKEASWEETKLEKDMKINNLSILFERI
jgi:methionyl-tRNA synthetase